MVTNIAIYVKQKILLDKLMITNLRVFSKPIVTIYVSCGNTIDYLK